MIKETDVDNAQWNRSSICLQVKEIPQKRASERIVEESVEVVQIIAQERVQNLTVERIFEVVHSIPMERIPE